MEGIILLQLTPKDVKRLDLENLANAHVTGNARNEQNHAKSQSHVAKGDHGGVVGQPVASEINRTSARQSVVSAQISSSLMAVTRFSPAPNVLVSPVATMASFSIGWVGRGVVVFRDDFQTHRATGPISSAPRRRRCYSRMTASMAWMTPLLAMMSALTTLAPLTVTFPSRT